LTIDVSNPLQRQVSVIVSRGDEVDSEIAFGKQSWSQLMRSGQTAFPARIPLELILGDLSDGELRGTNCGGC
jgi:hypothetical protein